MSHLPAYNVGREFPQELPEGLADARLKGLSPLNVAGRQTAPDDSDK